MLSSAAGTAGLVHTFAVPANPKNIDPAPLRVSRKGTAGQRAWLSRHPVRLVHALRGPGSRHTARSKAARWGAAGCDEGVPAPATDATGLRRHLSIVSTEGVHRLADTGSGQVRTFDLAARGGGHGPLGVVEAVGRS